MRGCPNWNAIKTEVFARRAPTEITPAVLVEKGLLKNIESMGLKVLGDGEVTRAMTVKANKFSKSAVQKIEAAGGKVEVL